MTSSKRRNKAKNIPAEEFRGQILAWYDRNGRNLPWRIRGKRKPDPYRVWLSEIMLQQTTVAAVGPYFTKFMSKWPDVESLAAAPLEEVMAAWAGLGYYARARNLHACAKLIAKDYKSRFPKTQDELKKLPGIGDYTSAAIASIAFDQPATVMDANIERVIARYFALEEPLPAAKKKLKELTHSLSAGQAHRPGDYAQAMMDLGAVICTPKAPLCGLCPVMNGCKAYAAGIQEQLPRRNIKSDKPRKVGFVYWVEDSKKRVLIHRRPAKGMLGGMAGLPTSEWVSDNKRKSLRVWQAIKVKKSRQSAPDIYHSFTHFDLQLIPARATLHDEAKPPDNYFWCAESDLVEIGFPTLFKKAWRAFKPRNIAS